MPTLCDQFFLDMHATSGQQAGNLRTSLKTLGKDWKASGALGKPSVSVGSCWKPSFWQIFFTFSSRNRSGIGFMSSRLVGMTAWVSGLQKSSFWQKIQEKQGKNDDFLILASGLAAAGARSVKNSPMMFHAFQFHVLVFHV